MRIRKAEDIAPIEIMPGDSIQLTYREVTEVSTFARLFGERPEVVEQVLMTETFNERRTIDRVAVVELENGELEALGMDQASAGVFGRQA
jgi:hypothetical protein